MVNYSAVRADGPEHPYFKEMYGLCRRAGHEDARRGMGFRKEYECWDTNRQWEYESGRLECCNMMAANVLDGFVWRKGVTEPRAYRRLVSLADHLVGEALPPVLVEG